MRELNLDDVASYADLDPDDMFRRVNDLPEQIQAAWDISSRLDLPDDYRQVSAVLITGMGGSAIGGSLLEGYATPACPVPIVVWRGYGVPRWVGKSTLVIAVSYSGNTEETLSAAGAAHDAGAKLLMVSTGGQIARLAQKWNAPLVSFSYPAQPRATLGYLFTPLLRIVQDLGFLPDQEAAISEAVRVARAVRDEWGGETPTSSNLAKQLATELRGRIGVVYAADYLAAVARRWKTQLNENSKNWAFYEEFSELNHNAIVGFEFPEHAHDNVQVIVLDSPLYSDRVRARIGVTGELMDEFGVSWRRVEPHGAERLSHMVSQIALGDYTSYYLALLNRADPTTIRPIDTLKDALAKI